MNQYIVFALSRITTADAIADQRDVFESLLKRYPSGEAEAALREILDARR